MIFFWIILIAVVSIFWAIFSYQKEKNKKELKEASREITKGRVIFHSSSVGDSDSSS